MFSLFFICFAGISLNAMAQGPLLPPLVKQSLESLETDLRVVGVVSEISRTPVAIAVVRRLSDGASIYLKQGEIYHGAVVKRITRGEVVLQRQSQLIRLEHISEDEQDEVDSQMIAKTDDDDQTSADSDLVENVEEIASENWIEVESEFSANKKQPKKMEVATAEDILDFELRDNKKVEIKSKSVNRDSQVKNLSDFEGSTKDKIRKIERSDANVQ